MAEKNKEHWLEKPRWGLPGYVWLGLGLGVLFVAAGLVGVFLTKNDLNGFIAVGLAIAGGGFLIWRSKLFERRMESTEEQIKIANRQAETQEAGLVVQRWKDSIQLLSSSNPGVLIGGIESLYQVTMENLETYGDSAIQILCDFVQNRSKENYGKRVKEVQEIKESKEPLERFSGNLRNLTGIKDIPNEIMNAFNRMNALRPKIGYSLESSSKFTVSDCTFSRAGFCSPADGLGPRLEYIIFVNTDFIESAFQQIDLSGINFIACDLSGAKFWGVTRKKSYFAFRYCNLMGASFLEKSTLTGVKFISVNLTATDFSEAENLTFEQLKDTFYTIHPITGKREDGRPKLPDYISENLKLQYYENHYKTPDQVAKEGLPINTEIEIYKKWLGKGTPTNPTTPPPS